jgi:release factor glutamine methyltransferase
MSVNIRTIKDIRPYLASEIREIFNEHEISALTNLIIMTVIGISRLHQIYNNDHPITSLQSEKIIDICRELKTGKPIQYILGETTFYDCPIKVNSSTLIPRPETEELVDLIIKENQGYTGKIIDIGTGSGCIAIALAANIPGANVTGIDISDSALQVAIENGELNKVVVSFISGDIFSYEFAEKAGIIVSNPPYVRDSEKQFMKLNVLGFEPHTALFVSDSDPLVFYRAILDFAKNSLIKGGRLYFEINEAMGNNMIQLLEKYFYTDIHVIRDLNGKERIIKGIKND